MPNPRTEYCREAEVDIIREDTVMDQQIDMVFQENENVSDAEIAKKCAEIIHELALENGWELTEYFVDMTLSSLTSE